MDNKPPAAPVTPTTPGSTPAVASNLNPSDIENEIPGVPLTAVDADKTVRELQIGETGTVILNGLLSAADYNPDLTGSRRIDEYDKMRLGDGTVGAALRVVKLPLKSANWFIQPPKGLEETDPITMFINEQIVDNDNFSFTQLLGKILTFCDYGNAIFEKVFYPTKDGKIGLKKLGHRLSKTIYRWTLQDGKTPGITQFLPAAPNGQTMREIPRWKLMMFINELEGSNYEGISLMRRAHKHWYFKDLYYKIDVMATEKHGLGVPVINHPPNANPKDVAKARELAKNIRANNWSHMDLPIGFSITMMDMKSLELKDPKEMIAHHNREIFVSFLAQFLDLGSNSKGSYALSSDQSDVFMLSLEEIAKTIQEPFNLLIKELVIMNFGEQKEYPTLQYAKIGVADIAMLSASLKDLADGGYMHPDATLEKKLREEMNLPEMQDEKIWDNIDPTDPTGMNAIKKQMMLNPAVDPATGKPVTPPADPKKVPTGKPIIDKQKDKFIQASEEFMDDMMELRADVERLIHVKSA